MDKVYRNKPEIPIPAFAYLNNHDAGGENESRIKTNSDKI